MPDPRWLRSYLAVSNEERYGIVNGGQLKLNPGIVECFATFTELVPGYATLLTVGKGTVQQIDPRAPGDEDHVVGKIRITDRDGTLYECERAISANKLFDLVRVPVESHLWPEAEPILLGVRSVYDRRVRVPAVGENDTPVIYVGKHLVVFFDLLVRAGHSSDNLVIRVHAKDAQVVGPNAPEVISETLWAGRIILSPNLMNDRYVDLQNAPVFVRASAKMGAPQPDVHVVDA